MKIKKFGEYIMGTAVACAAMPTVILGICAYFAFQNGQYRILLLGLGLSLAFVASFLIGLRALLLSRADSLADLIIIDEAGISLKRKKGADEFIPWAEIFSINRNQPYRSYPVITVTGIAGNKISWYTEDTEFEKYMCANHPELEFFMNERV